MFVLWPREGKLYLSKTAVLRRRVLVSGERIKPSAPNLRDTVARLEYRLTGSGFESAVVHYEQARRMFPDTYFRRIKLRMPPT